MISILQTIKLKSRQVKQFVKFIVVSGRGNTHVQTFLASTLFHLDQTPAALPQNSLLPGQQHNFAVGTTPYDSQLLSFR